MTRIEAPFDLTEFSALQDYSINSRQVKQDSKSVCRKPYAGLVRAAAIICQASVSSVSGEAVSR